MATTTRTAAEAHLIVTGVLALLGVDVDDDLAIATRKSGEVHALGLTDEVDEIIIVNAKTIAEVTEAAGARFTRTEMRGFPVLVWSPTA
ncbi:hypothetical protein SEA_MISCHIEF19_3 [Streptomyces phage Mischief19]|nr:hypothetical protein SEA_MISCHIEF19_3 [Streptomyces phage Mischief19]